MALINPVHGLVVPFLCLFTIPLAIFAGITTTLAFTVLMFRVAVVYLDIALSMIPQYFRGRSKTRFHDAPPITHHRRHSRATSIAMISPPGSMSGDSGHSTPSPIAAFPPVPSTPYTPMGGLRSPFRRKSSYGFGGTARHSRRSSQVSLASLGAVTPIREGCVTPACDYGETNFASSTGIDRDFEGIGGWRLGDRDDDADWTNINSRLELPLDRSTYSARQHQRSQSAGPVTPGGNEATWLLMKATATSGSGSQSVGKEAMNFSPNISGRLRSSQSLMINSAIATMERDNGYFPLVSPKR
ncbi:hypothetical protein V8F20_007385 [Naviculisporaceae sp. PSN 640]